MTKTKDEISVAIEKAKNFLQKIEKAERPNHALQEDAKIFLTKLKEISHRKRKSVIAQKIEKTLNEIKKTETPSLFVQEVLIKDAMHLFIKNFE